MWGPASVVCVEGEVWWSLRVNIYPAGASVQYPPSTCPHLGHGRGRECSQTSWATQHQVCLHSTLNHGHGGVMPVISWYQQLVRTLWTLSTKVELSRSVRSVDLQLWPCLEQSQTSETRKLVTRKVFLQARNGLLCTEKLLLLDCHWL